MFCMLARTIVGCNSLALPQGSIVQERKVPQRDVTLSNKRSSQRNPLVGALFVVSKEVNESSSKVYSIQGSMKQK